MGRAGSDRNSNLTTGTEIWLFHRTLFLNGASAPQSRFRNRPRQPVRYLPEIIRKRERVLNWRSTRSTEKTAAERGNPATSARTRYSGPPASPFETTRFFGALRGGKTFCLGETGGGNGTGIERSLFADQCVTSTALHRTRIFRRCWRQSLRLAWTATVTPARGKPRSLGSGAPCRRHRACRSAHRVCPWRPS